MPLLPSTYKTSLQLELELTPGTITELKAAVDANGGRIIVELASEGPLLMARGLESNARIELESSFLGTVKFQGMPGQTTSLATATEQRFGREPPAALDAMHEDVVRVVRNAVPEQGSLISDDPEGGIVRDGGNNVVEPRCIWLLDANLNGVANAYVAGHGHRRLLIHSGELERLAEVVEHAKITINVTQSTYKGCRRFGKEIKGPHYDEYQIDGDEAYNAILAAARAIVEYADAVPPPDDVELEFEPE